MSSSFSTLFLKESLSTGTQTTPGGSYLYSSIPGFTPQSFESMTVKNRLFHIQDVSPALWGDRLNVAAYLVELKPTGGTWLKKIERAANGESIMRCVLEWSAVNRVSGEEHSLPENLYRVLEERVNFGENNNIG